MKLLIPLPILTFVSILIPAAPVSPANILFYHNIASYSHRVTTYPLADALAKRGHHVTYISSFHPRGPYINPNITEIVPKSMSKRMQDFLDADFDIKFRIEKRFSRVVYSFYPTALTACEDLLTSPELHSFFNRTRKLDLVIIDNCMADCGVAIAYKYGAKHIFFNVVLHIPNEFDWYGFQPESSSIPEHEVDPPQTPMGFFERVFNTLISIHFRWIHYNYVKDVDKVVRKHLKVGENMPFLDDIARNMSLVFYTSDVISDYPRSHPPLIVNLAGIYCVRLDEKIKADHKLPEDVQNFLDDDAGDNDGFVYISLGSLVIPSTLPDNLKQMFFEMMRNFPKLKFLWKWDGGSALEKKNVVFDDLPKNLYLRTWFPQMDILAHPKIRGFIMQGGRPSTIEATCNAVPMIAFPVLGDQDLNAMRMNKMGANVLLEWGSVTLEQLKDAVNKTVYDLGMKTKMIQLQNILLDNPMSPVDKAVWWTEYVLRHSSTSHLRAAGFDQWWWQRRLLDVWIFLFIAILIIFAFLILAFYFVLKYFIKCKGSRPALQTTQQEHQNIHSKKNE